MDAHEAGLLPVRGHMLGMIIPLVPLGRPLLVVLLSVRSAVLGEWLKESALESLRFDDDLHPWSVGTERWTMQA